ncbi:MAG: phosphatase PAP2 family protein [Desulfovibrionaceae bacterium]
MSFAAPAWDLSLFFAVNHGRSPVLDWIMPLISERWLAVAILGAALAVFVLGRRWRPATLVLWIALSVVAVDAGTNVIKKAMGRVRPVDSLAEVHFQQRGQWRTRPADFVQTKQRSSSYFSAHSANSMCMAVMAMVFWRSLRPWLIIVPLAVGYSRMYLGQHFPSDVLAGWVFGAVSGWGLALAFGMIERCLAALRPAAAVQCDAHGRGDQKEHHAECDLDR